MQAEALQVVHQVVARGDMREKIVHSLRTLVVRAVEWIGHVE
jgi:hypothetical protein